MKKSDFPNVFPEPGIRLKIKSIYRSTVLGFNGEILNDKTQYRKGMVIIESEDGRRFYANPPELEKITKYINTK